MDRPSLKEMLKEQSKEFNPKENFTDGMAIARIWVSYRAEVARENFRRFKEWFLKKIRTLSKKTSLCNTSEQE